MRAYNTINSIELKFWYDDDDPQSKPDYGRLEQEYAISLFGLLFYVAAEGKSERLRMRALDILGELSKRSR